MGDIVATIQAEQDRIIRATPSGVLVVQGGPGTGKTAVALHRAAYLLYTHRDRLARRGVLVVGPNATFLRYIGQVLPSLGETSVVLGTVGQLFPGLDARRAEPPAVAEVKGRAEMAGVVAAAVRDRQQVPRRPVELAVEQQRVRLDRDLVNAARSRARRSRRPHNEAKRVFHREAVRLLAEQVARGLVGGTRGLLDAGDLSDIRDELAESRALTRELDALWPTLSAEQLLTDLFADRRRLDSVARRLPRADRELLARPAPDADVPADLRFTPADVPLLDEAAELLGDDGSEARAREAAALREEVLYAQGVLDVLDLEEDLDPELLRATDIVDADRLAERQRVRRYDSTADRAAADREWTYGHVIVDEAQELSAMAWRSVMRRCPTRSMTIVGDIAQTGDLAGAASWQDALGPFVAKRFTLAQLTVNYRTPAEIAAVADDVLAEIDPTLEPPRSVRATGVPPRAVRRRGDLGDAVAAVLAEEAAAGFGGNGFGATGTAASGTGAPARAGRRTAGSPCWRPSRASPSCGPACSRRRRPRRIRAGPRRPRGRAARVGGEGSGVRRGRAGRAGRAAGRVAARPGRPVRRADPSDAAAHGRARGPAARGAARSAPEGVAGRSTQLDGVDPQVSLCWVLLAPYAGPPPPRPAPPPPARHQPPVGGVLLGVPLDPHHERARRVLERLHRPVRGPRRRHEPRREPVDRLVVVAAHAPCRPRARRRPGSPGRAARRRR